MNRNRITYLIASSLFMMLIFSSCSGSNSKNDHKEKEEEEAKTEHSLRIMAYNIRHAAPPSKDGEIDIASIAKTIGQEDPDVVAVQEVDVNTERSGAGNQAQMIAEKLDMHYFFAKGIDFQGGEYGVAILSKYPLKKERTIPLPKITGEKGEPRALALAHIKIPGDRELIFASVHLDLNVNNRLLQIEAINKIAEEESELMILAGDFNSRQGSGEMKKVASVFRLTCGDCPPTFPETAPNRVIDFIAYKPIKQTTSVESHKVVADSYSSDHRPIVSVLNYTE